MLLLLLLFLARKISKSLLTWILWVPLQNLNAIDSSKTNASKQAKCGVKKRFSTKNNVSTKAKSNQKNRSSENENNSQ